MISVPFYTSTNEKKQLEDEVAEKLIAGALNIQQYMKGFKVAAFEECYGFVDLLRQKYNMERITSKSGTVTLKSFDGTKVVEIQVAKFADTGIEELLKKVIAAGASKTRLVAKIAGGAKMFEVSGLSDVGNIGARNAEAAKKILKEKGIRLVAEDTGLNYGRTVELHCDTGEFLIKSVGKPIKTI
jgi:chemotaxis protein CheD